MNFHVTLRVARSTVVAVALALSSLSWPIFAPAVARADSPPSPTPPVLVISEFNPYGSTGHPSDDWVELYNTTSSQIDFSSTPYRLATPSGTLVDLTAGSVLPNSYYLISREDPALLAASTDLGLTPDLAGVTALAGLGQDHRLELQTVAAGVATTVDQAGTPTAPLNLGSDGTGSDQVIASIARLSASDDGSLPASWYTPQSIGAGFKAGTVQYGTPVNHLTSNLNPAQLNLELARPTDLAVVQTPSQAEPTVSGKLTPTAGSGLISAYRITVQFTPIASVAAPVVLPAVAPSPQPDGSYTFTASPATALPVGMYHIQLFILDTVSGNRTNLITVPTGTAQDVYTVAPAVPVVVPPPTVNAAPTVTNATSLTLTGTVQAGLDLVVAINGSSVPTYALPPGQTTFSLPVLLQKDAVNNIEVRAVDTQGNISQPTVVSLTQDSIAPQIVAAQVKLTANQPGIDDTVAGQAGAVTDTSGETELTLAVYADQALTQPISTVNVSSDGSFPTVDIGDNKYAAVYLIAKDLAGNLSQPLSVSNPISFAGSSAPIAISFSGLSATQVTLDWNPVPGASYYTLDYKVLGGEYTHNPVILCKDPTLACRTSTTLINLDPNTQYSIALTAVDQFGNPLTTEQSIRTLAAPVPVVSPVVTPATTSTSAPATTTAATSTTSSPAPAPVAALTPVPATVTPAPAVPAPAVKAAPAVTATATPTPTPSITPSPTPSPSPTGEVKSAETTNSGSRNYTPWIILAVLIALAVLATLGYFYWFGAEEVPDSPLGRTVSPPSATPRRGSPPAAPTKESSPNKKAPPSKEKRW